MSVVQAYIWHAGNIEAGQVEVVHRGQGGIKGEVAEVHFRCNGEIVATAHLELIPAIVTGAKLIDCAERAVGMEVADERDG